MRSRSCAARCSRHDDRQVDDMQKLLHTAAMTIAILATTPAYAYAADGGTIVPAWLPYAAGFASLVVALALLSEVLRLRKLVFGAALSTSVSYVVAAVVCLGASALVYWLANFVPAVSGEHAVLAANLLVTAAMGLLVVYFATVRARLMRFMREMIGSLDDDAMKGGASA